MNINREILMTIVKNSSNRIEEEQEILEINEQQLHLINKELTKLFSLHVVSCSLTDKEKIDYELSQKQKIKHEEAKGWLHALWFVILIMFLFVIAVKGCS